jgi:hypothetical protein
MGWSSIHIVDLGKNLYPKEEGTISASQMVSAVPFPGKDTVREHDPRLRLERHEIPCRTAAASSLGPVLKFHRHRRPSDLRHTHPSPVAQSTLFGRDRGVGLPLARPTGWAFWSAALFHSGTQPILTACSSLHAQPPPSGRQPFSPLSLSRVLGCSPSCRGRAFHVKTGSSHSLWRRSAVTYGARGRHRRRSLHHLDHVPNERWPRSHFHNYGTANINSPNPDLFITTFNVKSQTGVNPHTQ